MAVAAHAARNVTPAARPGHREVRGSGAALVGTYPFQVGDELVTGWHFHDLHQLEYCIEGVAQVETPTARFLLPPHQAIWIPAGTEHCTTLTRVRTVAVFFDPASGINGGEAARILPAPPVVREMILYARRWPIGRTSPDPAADAFFVALGHLVEELLDHELPLRLPTSTHPLVAAAMEYTSAHLADVTVSELCAAIGTSERSLRRIFQAETGMSWRRYLLESRLHRAMAMLVQPAPTVLAVATATGFDSTSGFVRAFRRYTGQTPLAYRQAALQPPDGQAGGLRSSASSGQDTGQGTGTGTGPRDDEKGTAAEYPAHAT